MATHREFSPYYPPRARWYSPLLTRIDSVGHHLALDRLDLGRNLNAAELIGGLLVPGLAVYFRSPRVLGKAALLWATFLFLTFIIFLGYSIGNLAFGMLLSLHVSGFVYYCNPLLSESLRQRLLVTLTTLAALSLLVYLPARDILQSYFLMPLTVNGQVVVVRHISSMETVRQGDWVAYNISTDHDEEEGGIYILDGVGFHSGIAVGPVLAVPGDRIQFFADTFTVNGVSHPHLPHMPVTGGRFVSEKEWFVWPNLAINEEGNVREANLTNVLMHMAFVQKEQLIGRPFQRWFWRRQILS